MTSASQRRAVARIASALSNTWLIQPRRTPTPSTTGSASGIPGQFFSATARAIRQPSTRV